MTLSAERRRFDNGIAHWAELAAACLLVGGLIGDVSGFNGTTVDPLPWLIAAVVLIPRLFSFVIPAVADIAVDFLAAVALGSGLWLQASRLTSGQALGSGWFIDLLGCAGLVLTVAWRLTIRSRRGRVFRIASIVLMTSLVMSAVGVTWSAASHHNATCCATTAPAHPQR